MTKFSKTKIIILFSTFFFLFSIHFAEAAELDLTSQTQELGVDQQFQVDLTLDAEGETINAVEGKIVWSPHLLELKEIRDGDSIVNLWVERPVRAVSCSISCELVFSGIIPAGFEGVLSPYYERYKPGKIFSLIFASKNEGEGIIDLKDGRVLLHDGLGTPANVKISNFQFSISKEAPIFELPTLEDNEPPEDFKPEIAKDPSVFEGKWFLVFAAQDKGSGIAGYAIHENTRKKEAARINTKNWAVAESPYLLKDQNLRSYIYVKAVDKAGNERIVVIEPRYPLKWYEIWWIWGIIILVIIFAFIVFKKNLWRKLLLH